ncbi:Peptide chain release factor 2 [Rubripirellula amarantea]|uniref:Peptide chain release factor 2 n=1 Tax=Rubripirellula amarantea TaxID=2527999 RepID=A0A5C5WGI2_9BACT|nr:peptide chain release factor-like protein [Rubripirellula amarantea]TWT49219.1 Peptide chain release factor 2 [Rubripirellula amarantea]
MTHSQPPNRPELPRPDQRMAAMFLLPPHPTLLPLETLLADCDQRFQRRSGPGGQHRNKTSSGAFLTHSPTGITAEATERRSQADNRSIAFRRLRFQLAVTIRTPSVFDQTASAIENELRKRYENGNLKLRQENVDKPAVIAMLLNDLHAAGGQASLVGSRWNVSASAIVQCLKSHAPAFAWLNQCREHHGRRPLK